MGTTGGDRAKVAAAAEAAGVYAVASPQMGKQVVAFQAMMELMAKEFPGVFSGYKLAVTESHQRNKADVSGTAKAVVASLREMGVQEFKDVSAAAARDGGQHVDSAPAVATVRVCCVSPGVRPARRATQAARPAAPSARRPRPHAAPRAPGRPSARACAQSRIRKVRDREGQLRFGVPEDYLDGHAYHTYTLTSPDDSVQVGLGARARPRAGRSQGMQGVQGRAQITRRAASAFCE